MKTLVLLALVGLGAQLVDGSLGMAYGVTSTTLLLAIGTNPAAASATVHFAEIGTTLVSGLAHWKFGNVDWKVVAKIGLPGAVGAFAGATVLSSLSTEVAAPVMSLILLSLGVYLLVRFTLRGIDRRHLGKPMRKRFLGPLGLVAGLRRRHRWRRLGPGGHAGDPGQRPDGAAQGDRLDRHLRVPGRARRQPRLPAGLGSQGVDATWALGLLVGGLIAAPIAAWLVRHIPPRMLGSLVGGMIVHDQHPHAAEQRLDRRPRPGPLRDLRGALRVWAAAVVHSFRQYRKDRALESAEAIAADGRDPGERPADVERECGPPAAPPSPAAGVRATDAAGRGPGAHAWAHRRPCAGPVLTVT